jgi:hypothetical protein
MIHIEQECPRPGSGETCILANGYRVAIGPLRDDGCRDVRVFDPHGRASGHTAVASEADLERLLANVRARPARPAREIDLGEVR